MALNSFSSLLPQCCDYIVMLWKYVILLMGCLPEAHVPLMVAVKDWGWCEFRRGSCKWRKLWVEESVRMEPVSQARSRLAGLFLFTICLLLKTVWPWLSWTYCRLRDLSVSASPVLGLMVYTIIIIQFLFSLFKSLFYYLSMHMHVYMYTCECKCL